MSAQNLASTVTNYQTQGCIVFAVNARLLLLGWFRCNSGKNGVPKTVLPPPPWPRIPREFSFRYALGLGVEKDLDTAHTYFVSASIEGDALGQNGLGYIYFHGTPKQERNPKLAFQHFNESSYAGSADGMFNLASVYLTGVGVDQSFQKAVLWYTQALDRGHTPAAYSLAIMHLNVGRGGRTVVVGGRGLTW